MRCRPCPAGYTSTSGAAECTICPAGFYSPVAGSGACIVCAAGSISAATGSSRCALCPAGHFSPVAGATACQPVPPGYFSFSAGSTGYRICDQGTYNAVAAQAVCQPCASGTVTANFGSVNEDDCVSPRINFIAVGLAVDSFSLPFFMHANLIPGCLSQGYVSIAAAAVMSIVYIVFARFEKLSFGRRERFVRPLAERMKALTEALDLQVAKLLEDIQLGKAAAILTSLSPTAKVCVFLVASVFLVVGSAAYLFLLVLRKLFVNLLIGWKSMGLGSLRIMFARFVGVAAQLLGVLQIPSHLVRAFLSPLELLCKAAELFDVGSLYRLLTVACEGAKAPIELFIDSFVLGVAIMFVKSDYNFLWAMTFHELNRLTLVKYWIQGRRVLSLGFFLAAAAFALTAVNPFITMLRFLLSFVNLGAFFVNNHVTHALSPACIGISGFENQELLLVNSTSVLVWWLLGPMLYSLADIVCPRGGFTDSKTALPRWCWGGGGGSGARHGHGHVFVVAPLLEDRDDDQDQDQEQEQDHSEDEDEEDSSIGIGSVVVSAFEDMEDSSLDMDSIVISEDRSIHGSAVDADDEDDVDVEGLEIDSGLRPNNSHGGASGSGSVGGSSSHYSSVSSVELSEGDARCGSISVNININMDLVLKKCEAKSDRGSAISTSRSCSPRGVTDADADAASDDGDLLAAEGPTSVTLTYTAAAGLCRYAGSYLSLLHSSDLLLIYLIKAYLFRFQKAERVEQLRQLRSHRRWEPLLVLRSVRRFQEQQHSKKKRKGSWGRYWSFFRRFETAARQADKEFAEKWAAAANMNMNMKKKMNMSMKETETETETETDEETKLPPYYRLCFMVQADLVLLIRIVYSLRPVAVPLAYLLAFSGLGHGLTAVGRKYWLIVLRKYALFFCACAGFWTDETYEAYGIADLVREFTISDPSEATVQFIPLTIASRAVLLQCLGRTAALISILVINICVAPLLVFSPKLLRVLPPLLHLRPREVAVDRERMELLGRRSVTREESAHVHVEEWVVVTRSLSILLTESRCIVFLFNLVSLALTVMILEDMDISARTLALLLLGMLPYYVGFALTPILYVGKRLNLKDQDFQVAFLGWLPSRSRSRSRSHSRSHCGWCRRSPQVRSLVPADDLSSYAAVHIEVVIDADGDGSPAPVAFEEPTATRAASERDRDSDRDNDSGSGSGSGFSSVFVSEEDCD